MASSKAKPNYSRRFFWLTVFIVVLFGGYSITWFYFAGRLQTAVAATIASLNRNGTAADCTKATARGFPFRMGLFCEKVRYDDSRQGLTASAAAFRSAAQIYDPFHIVAELDSPAMVSAPNIGALGFDWDKLRASVRLATDFPERVSTEIDRLAVKAVAGGSAASLFGAAHAEVHMRRNGGDLDLAASITGAAIDQTLTQGAQLPPLAGAADLTISGGVNLVRSGENSLRGHSGTIRTFDLSSDPQTGLSLSGPFSVGNDGLLDADLKVTIHNPKALAEHLAQAFPSNADQIRSSFGGLAALGSNPSLPLKVKGGKATLGFIPLGVIPPL